MGRLMLGAIGAGLVLVSAACGTTTGPGPTLAASPTNSRTSYAGSSSPAAAVSAPIATVQTQTATASLLVDDGATSAWDPNLVLTLGVGNFGSNVQMRFSLDGGSTWTAAAPFAAMVSLPLPPKQPWGTVTVTGEFFDSAGARVRAATSIAYVEAQQTTMLLRPTYLLAARLDYDKAQLAVMQTVDIVNDSAGAIGFLDFSVLARPSGEMRIGAVTIDGRSVAVTYPNSASMRVPLGYNLRSGEGARVTINFTDTAGSNVDDAERSRLSTADGLMQISSWHPVLSDGHGPGSVGDPQYTVAADYRLELRHSAGIVIAAPGTLVRSSATSKVYTLANAREFAFGASPSFVTDSARTADGVTVVVYHLAGVADVSKAVAIAVESIEHYSAALGSYPYRRFVIVQGARSYSGEEYSGATFIGPLWMGTTYVVSHEAAHQWWYGLAGNDQINEPWLDEAFAEFTGRYFFNEGMPTFCSTLPVNSAATEFPISLGLGGCNSYIRTVYFKGAAFLDGIRARMGTDPFFSALRAIVSENRLKIATTQIVRATFLRFASDPTALDEYMSEFLR